MGDGEFSDGLGKTCGKRGWVDGFEVAESDGAFLLLMGGGSVSLKSYGLMVGDVEVVTGQVTDCDASGTDQIQGVAFVMSWKIDVLGDVEE